MNYKIKNKTVVIFLSLLCSFIPMSFYYIPIGSLIIPLLRVLRLVIICYYIMILVRRKRISIRLLKIMLFFTGLFISTIWYGGGLSNYIDNCSVVLIVFLMVENYIYCNDEQKTYYSLKSIYIYFLGMLLVNTFFMIALPQGVYRVIYEKDFWHELSYPVHFLNSDNRLIEFEMPLFLLTIILYKKKLIGKTSLCLSLLLIIFTMLRADSLTSVTGIIITAVIMFVIRERDVSARWFLIYPFFFPVQLAFEMIMTNKGILALLGFIFGRVDTIQSRYLLGKQAKEVISENLLLGVGTAKSGRMFSEGNVIYWVHNHAMDILVQSGILGGMLFVINLIKLHYKKRDKLNDVQKIIFSGMIGMLIMGISESFIYSIEFYLVLSLTDI